MNHLSDAPSPEREIWAQLGVVIYNDPKHMHILEQRKQDKSKLTLLKRCRLLLKALS